MVHGFSAKDFLVGAGSNTYSDSFIVYRFQKKFAVKYHEIYSWSAFILNILFGFVELFINFIEHFLFSLNINSIKIATHLLS